MTVMSDAEIYRFGPPISLDEFDVLGRVDQLIRVGRHAIRGYTWKGQRVMNIYERFAPPESDQQVELLGYGKGATAEEALVRAAFTWSLPKLSPYINEQTYPESVNIRISPELKDYSQLDLIVQRGEFWLRPGRQEEIIAGTDRGRGNFGDNAFEVGRATTLDAIRALTRYYVFFDQFADTIERLPPTLLGGPEFYDIDEDSDGDDGA
jgi:hypothetical protein